MGYNGFLHPPKVGLYKHTALRSPEKHVSTKRKSGSEMVRKRLLIREGEAEKDGEERIPGQ